jgi:hypothetical protein
MAVDMVPVGSVGADGRKTLEVAAVLLTAKGMEPLKDTLAIINGGWIDTPWDVIVVAVFASSVVCAVFVGVAGEEIETHMFILLTGKEERFQRMWGWF